MKWLAENWYLIVVVIAVVLMCVVMIKNFINLPSDAQIANFKEWLRWAVAEAERELGSGTGQLKLRMVYDLAIRSFSWFAVIPFETFSAWVDEALSWLNEQLKSNEKVQTYISEAEEG